MKYEFVYVCVGVSVSVYADCERDQQTNGSTVWKQCVEKRKGVDTRPNGRMEKNRNDLAWLIEVTKLCILLPLYPFTHECHQKQSGKFFCLLNFFCVCYPFSLPVISIESFLTFWFGLWSYLLSSICLSLCICISLSLAIYLSISIYLSICLSINLLIYLYIFIHQSVHTQSLTHSSFSFPFVLPPPLSHSHFPRFSPPNPALFHPSMPEGGSENVNR